MDFGESHYIDLSFESFKKRHQIEYNDLNEHEYRREVFKHNLRFGPPIIRIFFSFANRANDISFAGIHSQVHKFA